MPVLLRLGFLIWAVRDSFDGEIRCRGETDEPAARRSPGRPVSPASRGDHQPSPSAGAAGGGDRLGLSGGTLQLGVSGGTRAAAVADAARAVHSQAHAQPLRRGAVRAMGGEPVFPVLLWGSGVPARAARQRLGEEQIVALLQESLSVAHRTGAIDTKDLDGIVERAFSYSASLCAPCALAEGKVVAARIANHVEPHHD